ncbi:serine threonine-protein [Stylonychia lemnae]|uniref:Serine threonine-protein n=1 Tax=Stylonychia lemnae TaxID=5949 RepID=A0A077ZVI6_STYLE|nr:serine threonine-protein [Stylonychia lemnae]|eukprot:CDW73930.1 serine threonine-protein [Stylonychia lemnae]
MVLGQDSDESKKSTQVFLNFSYLHIYKFKLKFLTAMDSNTCKICQKSYAFVQSLRKHMNANHWDVVAQKKLNIQKDNTVSCDYCTLKLKSKDSLRNHKRRSHVESCNDDEFTTHIKEFLKHHPDEEVKYDQFFVPGSKTNSPMKVNSKMQPPKVDKKFLSMNKQNYNELFNINSPVVQSKILDSQIQIEQNQTKPSVYDNSPSETSNISKSSDQLSSIRAISESNVTGTDDTYTDVAVLQEQDQLNNMDQNLINTQLGIDQFRRIMYTQITKESDLLWTINNKIIPNNDNDNPTHLTRSNSSIVKNPQLNNYKSQPAYGEATQGAVKKLISIFQDIGCSNNCIFADIGSGFGKLVFDFALTTPMECHGYEMVDARYDLSVQKLKQYRVEYTNNTLLSECLSRVEFYFKNSNELASLTTPSNKPYSHMYTYNYRFNDDDNDHLVKLIKNSPYLQVFAWNKSEHTTIKTFGLQEFQLHKDFKVKLAGAKESHKMYVYKRIELNIPEATIVKSTSTAKVPLVNEIQFQVEPIQDLQIPDLFTTEVSQETLFQNLLRDLQISSQQYSIESLDKHGLKLDTAIKILQSMKATREQNQATKRVINEQSQIAKIKSHLEIADVIKFQTVGAQKTWMILNLYNSQLSTYKWNSKGITLETFTSRVENLAKISQGWFEVKQTRVGKAINILSKAKGNEIADIVSKSVMESIQPATSQSKPSNQILVIDEQVITDKVVNTLEMEYQVNSRLADALKSMILDLDDAVFIESEDEQQQQQDDMSELSVFIQDDQFNRLSQQYRKKIQESYLRMNQQKKRVQKQMSKNKNAFSICTSVKNEYLKTISQNLMSSGRLKIKLLQESFQSVYIKPQKELSADIFGERFKCDFIPIEGALPKVSQYLLRISHLSCKRLVQLQQYDTIEQTNQMLAQFKNDSRILPFTQLDTKAEKIFTIYESSGMEFKEFLKVQHPVVADKAKLIVNLIESMSKVHKKKIYHGSLSDKAINIIGQSNLKIHSWGTPVTFDSKDPAFKLIQDFAAPEQFHSVVYDKQLADCFSVGVLCYYIIHNEFPYPVEEVNRWLKQAPKNKNLKVMPCKKPLCNETFELMRSLLKRDYTKRSPLAKALQHPQYVSLVEFINKNN